MSGGIAYVVDIDGQFAKRCNTAMVDLESVLGEAEQEARLPREIWHYGLTDEVILKRLIENHARYTGSSIARRLLEDWATARTKLVKVFPKEYRRALGELAARHGKLAA
jgi:glutamate synthase domain-containing protein 3